MGYTARVVLGEASLELYRDMSLEFFVLFGERTGSKHHYNVNQVKYESKRDEVVMQHGSGMMVVVVGSHLPKS